MSGRYQDFSIIKDSNVEWLGDIPSHWNTNKLGGCATITRLAGYEYTAYWKPIEDGEIIALRGQNIKFNKLVDLDNVERIANSLSMQLNRSRLYKNDIVYPCVGSIGNATLIIEDNQYHINQNIAKLTPKEHIFPLFLSYFLNSSVCLESALFLNTSDAQPSILVGNLRRVKMASPPFNEQQEIASFLDHETAKIDTLIAKQEKLIALLKEKCQAVISHAVIRGLNPNAPMKNSGVEWLGEVPEHWIVCRLKYIKGKEKNAFVDGPFGSNLKTEHFVDNGDVYVIESNFATTGILDKTKLKTISESHFLTINRSETKEGNIILAKIGARYGMNSIMPTLDKKAVVSGNSLTLSVDAERMNVNYCHHLLTHLKQEEAMEDGVNVTAQPALSLGQLNNLPFLALPLDEQDKIVCFIEEQESYFSSLILNSEKMIELSKERKTALISAVVTGKIDVRNWQDQ